MIASRLLPPTLNALKISGNDIIEDILPSCSYHYKDEDVDFRSRLYNAIYDMYGDDHVGYCSITKFSLLLKKKCTLEKINTLGKQLSIYDQNRESDVDYANFENTQTSEIEELPDTVYDSSKKYLTQKQTLTNKMVQPSGPLGAATLIKDSMNAISNPIVDFVNGLSELFIPVEVICYAE